MARTRKSNTVRKDAQLLIRIPSATADSIKIIAFMKGESLGDWLERVAAPELAAAGVEVFNIGVTESRQ